MLSENQWDLNWYIFSYIRKINFILKASKVALKRELITFQWYCMYWRKENEKWKHFPNYSCRIILKGCVKKFRLMLRFVNKNINNDKETLSCPRRTIKFRRTKCHCIFREWMEIGYQLSAYSILVFVISISLATVYFGVSFFVKMMFLTSNDF